MRYIVVKPEAERLGPKIPAVPYSDFDRNRHYWDLKCGHVSDLDTDAMMRDQYSPRDRLWCDKCGTFRLPKPKPRPRPVPQEPLF